MQRSVLRAEYLFCCVFLLAGCAADETKPQPCTASPAMNTHAYVAVATATKNTHPNVKDPYVNDLLDLIVETKSVDVFIVTVSLLSKTKSDARQVIPTIIRNAERLGIYGNHLMDEDSKEAEIAQDLSEIISVMSQGDTSTDLKKAEGLGKDGNRLSEKDSKTAAFAKCLKEKLGEMSNYLFGCKVNQEPNLTEIEYEWEKIWFTDHPKSASDPMPRVE